MTDRAAVAFDTNDLRRVVMAAVGFNMGIGARPDRDPKDIADIWESCVRVGLAAGLRVDPHGGQLDEAIFGA